MAYDPNSPASDHAALSDLDKIRENTNQLRKFEASDTEPSSPVAGMFWLYTPGSGNWVLKQRKPDDSGWIDLWEIDPSTGAIKNIFASVEIATSGIVGLPRQSFVEAYMYNGGSNYSVSATTWTKVPFDTIVTDVQGDFDTTNNRFTAPEGGKYLCQVIVRIYGLGDQQYCYMRFYKNGALLWPSIEHHMSGVYAATVSFNCVVDCVAGDYLECWIYGQAAFSILYGQDNTTVWFAKIA